MANHVSPLPPTAPVGSVDQGIDLAHAWHGDVYAVGSGVVTKVDAVGGPHWGGLGAIYIRLDHPITVNGRTYKSVYVAETGQHYVQQGDKVKAGQRIAYTRSGWTEIGFANDAGTGPIAPDIRGANNRTKPTTAGYDFRTFVTGAPAGKVSATGQTQQPPYASTTPQQQQAQPSSAAQFANPQPILPQQPLADAPPNFSPAQFSPPTFESPGPGTGLGYEQVATLWQKIATQPYASPESQQYANVYQIAAGLA